MSGVLLSINVHGIGPEARANRGAELFGRLGHGRYAYRVGLARMLDWLAADGLSATLFWPTAEIERAPALFDRALRDGHEVAAHGEDFEDLAALAPAEEEELLARMTWRLAALTGATPAGFRSATGTLSQRTLPCLARLGYRYDSSMVDDDAPYGLGPDGAQGMVELPWFEQLSDATHYARRFTQARAEQAMTEELGPLLDVAGYACLVLTPRSDIGSGRAARLATVRRLCDIVRARGLPLLTGRALAAALSGRA